MSVMQLPITQETMPPPDLKKTKSLQEKQTWVSFIPVKMV